MESVYNKKTRAYFNISDEDFDQFQELFSRYEPRSHESAVCIAEGEKFSREYTEDEIKGIFDLDCEYSGRDKEMAKDNVADLGERRDAEAAVKKSIKDKNPIPAKYAKTILAIIEAFESYECEIDRRYNDNDGD